MKYIIRGHLSQHKHSNACLLLKRHITHLLDCLSQEVDGLQAPRCTATPHLEVIFSMHCQPVTKHIPGDHHVGFHTIYSKPVHAKELGEKGIPMTFHNELNAPGGGGGKEEEREKR